MMDYNNAEREHKIIFNKKIYGLTPSWDDYPIDMMIVNGHQVKFEDYNGFIEDTEKYRVTYEILDNNIYISSFLIMKGVKKVEDEDGCYDYIPIYVEKIDIIFDLDINKRFLAKFITGIIEFDDYDCDKDIKYENSNKFYCHIEKGHIIKVVKKINTASNKIIDEYFELYNRAEEINENIEKKNLLNSENISLLPLSQNDIKNFLDFSNLRYNKSLSPKNSQEKPYNDIYDDYSRDTFDALDDGNNGRYDDFDGDISDILDNMGRG